VARTRSDDIDKAEPSGEITVVPDDTAKESQADLLAIIWQTLQKGEEERKEKERKDEEYRKKIQEIRQKERDDYREILQQMRQVIIRNTPRPPELSGILPAESSGNKHRNLRRKL
jgi:hypothetical protein